MFPADEGNTTNNRYGIGELKSTQALYQEVLITLDTGPPMRLLKLTGTGICTACNFESKVIVMMTGNVYRQTVSGRSMDASDFQKQYSQQSLDMLTCMVTVC